MDPSDLFALFAQFAGAFDQRNRLLRLRVAGGIPVHLIAWQVRGEEAVSGEYCVDVECLSADTHLELKSLLGRVAELGVQLDGGGERCVSGLVSEAAQTGSDGGFARYRLRIEPGLALLAHRRNSRVFQNQSVPAIVDTLLAEHRERGGPWAAACRWEQRLRKTYPIRSTCLQYRESDRDFLRRLLAEEGIATRYEFSAPADEDATPVHTLILFDDPYEPTAAAQPLVRFGQGGAGEKTDTLTGWQAARQLRTRQSGLASYDYKPASTLQAASTSPVDQGDSGTAVEDLLTDHAPQTHYYGSDPDDLARYAELRQAARDRFAKHYTGDSQVRALAAGHWFQLAGHPRHEGLRPDDASFLVRELRWEARNNLPDGLRQPLAALLGTKPASHGNTDQNDDPPPYRNTLVAVRRDTPVAPDVASHPRPTAPGLQTATVTGPAGEEVHTDALGRIKVQFHWVRHADHPDGGAAFDDRSGAWLRVLTPWAGDGWGSQTLPRIGQEVLVDFLEGDIDRPVIIGSLYNGSHPPPEFSGAGHLPGNRAIAGLRSREHHGSGANQLLLDDTTGQLRAQLGSSHGETQLNLGYLTAPRTDGAATPRGEGVELRTDYAGAVRAAKGLLLSADAQPGASGPHMAREPALAQLEAAKSQARAQGDTAAHHNAEAGEPDATDWGRDDAAHIIMSAPAGIALTTPQAMTLASGQDLHQVSGRDTQQTTARRWVHNVGEQISLFVRGVKDKAAIKLFAAQGDIDVQAQGGEVEVIADDSLTITSTEDRIVVAAKEHITLLCGGAYIKIADGNIELAAPKGVSFGAATYEIGGATSMSVAMPQFPGDVCKECLKKAAKTGSPFALLGS